METKTVHLYVFDSLSDWEAGYAAAGINNPQLQARPGRYTIRTVASRKGPVTTVGGIRIQPDLLLELSIIYKADIAIPYLKNFRGNCNAHR